MDVIVGVQSQYLLAAVLLLVGLYGILVKTNLARKLMAMNVMQVAVIVFFISLAVRTGGTPPIEIEHTPPEPETEIAYANPLPHALMLTAIVVSVSTTGVALALLVRIHRRFDTFDETELLDRLR